jgi:type I restriction enzyme, S subunit
MITPTLHASHKTKKTAIGELPVEWDVCPFGRIVESSQYGVSFESGPAGRTPILRMNNINGGKIDLSNIAYVSADASELADYVAEKGDLLFNRTNSLELVGKTAIFDCPGVFTYASYLVRFRIRASNADPYFVNYFFNLPASRKRLRSLATPGVSQCNINPTVLQKYFLVVLPPLPEQQRIAAVLETWDRGLERLVTVLKAKQQFKRGLMQQLLSGKHRFPEFTGSQCMKMKIGQFTRPAQRVVKKPDESFKALGIRSHCKGTFLKRDFDPAAIEMTELFEVRKDDLIVNITFAWEGAIAIVGDAEDGALVSHRFPTYVFNKDLVLPEYFRYVIVQRSFVAKLGLISPGGAGRNRVLSKRDFAKIEVLVPPLPEQQRIAALLNGCDREIELLQAELTAFKDQKRGLMQELLSGKIRIRA